jgi:ABC-type lipoprotein release transport system permease subunit
LDTLIATVVLALATALAGFIPARQTSSIELMEVLRTE